MILRNDSRGRDDEKETDSKRMAKRKITTGKWHFILKSYR
jgi:hypothetical protein